MSQELYNLEWQTYSDHLREMLHGMMKSNELTDVTLVCDDKIQFKAHKIILSACSSVFKSIIKDLPQNHSVIYLRGIQHQEIESILEFVYLGVATFYKERINQFLDVAKNLKIKEISTDLEFETATDSKPEESSNETNMVRTERLNHNRDAVPREKSVIVRQDIIESELPKSTEENVTNCEPMIYDDANVTELAGEKQNNKKDKNSNEKSSGTNTTIPVLNESEKEMNTETFHCNQCELQFAMKSSLNRHVKSKHKGVKYPCKQCNKQFVWKRDMIIHIESVHEAVRYHCKECDYQAKHQTSLLRHMIKHQ